MDGGVSIPLKSGLNCRESFIANLIQQSRLNPFEIRAELPQSCRRNGGRYSRVSIPLKSGLNCRAHHVADPYTLPGSQSL